MTFRVVPAVPSVEDGIAYVEMVEPRASELFRRIRDGGYLGGLGKQEPHNPVSPADIHVRILDAGGPAREVQEYLGRAGFVVTGVERAAAGRTRTLLLYADGAGKEKAVLSSYLPLVPVELSEDRIAGADLELVVGPDFQGISP